MNTQTKITTAVSSACNAEERVTALDWEQIEADLDAQGSCPISLQACGRPSTHVLRRSPIAGMKP